MTTVLRLPISQNPVLLRSGIAVFKVFLDEIQLFFKFDQVIIPKQQFLNIFDMYLTMGSLKLIPQECLDLYRFRTLNIKCGLPALQRLKFGLVFQKFELGFLSWPYIRPLSACRFLISCCSWRL